MGELSPNACLVYMDSQLQIFDPGYNAGIEEFDMVCHTIQKDRHMLRHS